MTKKGFNCKSFRDLATATEAAKVLDTTVRPRPLSPAHSRLPPIAGLMTIASGSRWRDAFHRGGFIDAVDRGPARPAVSSRTTYRRICRERPRNMRVKNVPAEM